MALEAMNHASHLNTKIIVVLNDNGMAISPNIGAVAKLLNLLTRSPDTSTSRRTRRRPSLTCRSAGASCDS